MLPNNNITIFELIDKNIFNSIINCPEKFENFANNLCDGNIKGLWDNEDFMSKIVSINGLYLECATDSIRKNHNICLKAIEQNLKAKKFIDISIRKEVLDSFINIQKKYIQNSKNGNIKKNKNNSQCESK